MPCKRRRRKFCGFLAAPRKPKRKNTRPRSGRSRHLARRRRAAIWKQPRIRKCFPLQNKTVSVDTARVQKLTRLDVGAPIYANALTFSPDSRYLLVGGFTRDKNGNFQGAVQIRQTASGVLVRQFRVPAWVDSVFWTPDLKTVGAGCGQAVLTDTAGSEIWFWDAATGKLQNRLSLRGFTLRSLALSPNGATLAVGGVREETQRVGEIRLLNARTGQQFGALSHGDQVWSLAFSPNGKTLLSGSGQIGGQDWQNADVRLWDMQTQTGRHRFTRPHGNAQSRTVFSPDGTLIATGDGPEGDVLLWEAQTGKSRLVLKGHTAEVYSLAFSPDAKQLFTGSRDGTVRVWSLPSGACIDVLKEHPTAVHAVAVSPNGQYMASGDIKNNLVLWQIRA